MLWRMGEGELRVAHLHVITNFVATQSLYKFECGDPKEVLVFIFVDVSGGSNNVDVMFLN